jgi:hypothetical protein
MQSYSMEVLLISVGMKQEIAQSMSVWEHGAEGNFST